MVSDYCCFGLFVREGSRVSGDACFLYGPSTHHVSVYQAAVNYRHLIFDKPVCLRVQQ